MVKAAEALGYKLSISELEQLSAESQKIDLQEMDSISGGGNGHGDCWTDYNCLASWVSGTEDEHGHNAWCVTGWHCYMATLHTETKDKGVSCFADYKCQYFAQDTHSDFF